MNKTEHEKLKAICDKIGYEIKIDLEWDCTIRNDDYSEDVTIIRDVREIIFTPEFMDCIFSYLKNKL